MRCGCALALAVAAAGCGFDQLSFTQPAPTPAPSPPTLPPVGGGAPTGDAGAAIPDAGGSTNASADAGAVVDAGAPLADAGGGAPDSGPPPPTGVLASPHMGDIVTGDVTQVIVTVQGVSGSPGENVRVQALGPPYDGTGWVDITSTVSDTTPGSGLAAGAFPFSLTVQPAPYWLQGGLLSLRVLDGIGRTMPGFDYDFQSCFDASGATTYQALVATCGSATTSRVILVSPSPGPGDATPGPIYLNTKGAIDAKLTSDYYTAISAPPTLTAFQQAFGFGTPSELTATYFNAGDLGIGREMHCTPQSPAGAVCYVRNYGTFGGDPGASLAAAVNGAQTGGQGSFAAVAMAYLPGNTEPVQFMVYGADGNLSTAATLDTHGDNTSIPNNCLNCHALSGNYDPTALHVAQATFLPFDPAAFQYAAVTGFAFSDQQGALNALNQLVQGTFADPFPSTYVYDFLQASVAPDGTPLVQPTTPSGWSGTPGAARVYRDVVQPHCESCHAYLTPQGPLSFTAATDFQNTSAGILSGVCGTPGVAASHTMPMAEVPLARLWNSPARAYLVDFLQLATPCAP